jgi:uncharacterized protein with PIN domain
VVSELVIGRIRDIFSTAPKRFSPDASERFGGDVSMPLRLIADAMLGTLARWLRVLDYDVVYDPRLDDETLLDRAAAEGRILVTRDRRLLERKKARMHLLIDSQDPGEQLKQVVRDLGLRVERERLFGRCLECNQPLVPVGLEEARLRVPPYVAQTQHQFFRCPTCDRYFWWATHVDRMLERLHELGLLVQGEKEGTSHPQASTPSRYDTR